MVAVYLSNQIIQAVCGSAGKTVSVKSYCESILPIGLMSQGNIINRDGLVSFIKEFWAKNKLPKSDVTLVFGGAQLTNKILDVPSKIKEGALIDYLSREFNDFNLSPDTAYSRWVMSEDKKRKRATILATAAERPFLRSVVECFDAAGIDLTEICSGLSGVMTMLLKTPELEGKTSVVQYWNGEAIMNVLLIDGVYTYSNTNTISFEPGTPAFAIAVARQVNQIFQFMKAQQMTSRVTDVYITGMSEDDMLLCMDSIYQMDGTLNVEELPLSSVKKNERSKDAFRKAMAAVGAIAVDCGKFSLVKQLAKDKSTMMEKAELRKKFRPVIVLFVIAFVVCATLWAVNYYYESKLNELLDYNNSPEVLGAVAEYDSVQVKNDEFLLKLKAIDEGSKAIESYPLPNSKVNEVLYNCAEGLVDIEIVSYNASTGILAMLTYASDVNTVNQYIKILSEESVFSKVEYTGYSLNEKTGVYTVNVVCILSETAGREETN